MNKEIHNKMQKDAEKDLKIIKKLIQENQELKDNWNKLKDYIVKEYYLFIPLNASTSCITRLIDKMQELEGKSE